MSDRRSRAAYGGSGWSPRTAALGEELGSVWARCGVKSEFGRLRSVLLHRPGRELEASTDPDAVQMLSPLDPARARAQHDALAYSYTRAGVTVRYVEPEDQAPPNLLFVADLMFMTPEGAVIGRPASTVRAGEERQIARRLAALGIPILRTVGGRGLFEGADAAWLDPATVLLARGLRTSETGAAQVAASLAEQSVEAILVDLPAGTMHLMGVLRIVDGDLAIVWPGRLPESAIELLRSRGYRALFIPDEGEAEHGAALNFVTLGAREILMPAGNPVSRAFYERAGIRCHTVEVDELNKAAGSIGCMTGILERD